MRVIISLKTKKVAVTCIRGRDLVIFVVIEWLCPLSCSKHGQSGLV